MSLAHRYQDFSPKVSSISSGITIDDVELEEQKLEAFENGFQAGWDDAVNAQVASHTRISSDLEKNLADIAFSVADTRSAFTDALQPLFSDIVSVLLPEIARASIGAHTVSELTKMVDTTLDQMIEIAVAPANLDTIELMLDEKIQDPFKIVTDPRLGEGQVNLRVGTDERSIDLSLLTHEISDALNAFFNSYEEVKSDG